MLFHFLLFFSACSQVQTTDTSTQTTDTSTTTSPDACTQCLADGGTWQPEANECTENCAIQDISCFTESCPGSCEEDCAYCFDATSCEEAQCTWHQEAEAMWCTQ